MRRHASKQVAITTCTHTCRLVPRSKSNDNRLQGTLEKCLLDGWHEMDFDADNVEALVPKEDLLEEVEVKSSKAARDKILEEAESEAANHTFEGMVRCTVQCNGPVGVQGVTNTHTC